jgi:hypothetical protein
MVGLDVANDWLDRGASAHRAADRSGDAAHLAPDPDVEPLWVVVAAIAFVDIGCGGSRSRSALPAR